MDPIYLDHNSTTPPAPEVREAMVEALGAAWGNPSSAHVYGKRARQTIDRARQQVATLLGAKPDEIVFTSGGTESDNAAIVGVAEALEGRGRHLVVSTIEHPAVGEACKYLTSRGWQVSAVGVPPSGRLDPARIERALTASTVLISIMHSNNETGVLQPISEIAAMARARGILLHSDAAQSVGKLPVRVDDLGVDLLAIAGHKLYAPKGVGAMYVRAGTPFAGFLRGAGHEAGRRAGTENTTAIAGLGAACELAERELPERRTHMAAMRDELERLLRERFPDLVVHGSSVERLPNTLSAAILGVDANRLLAACPGIAASAGAACHSGTSHPSHVLAAMGVPRELAACTLRLTVGRDTTREEVQTAAEAIAAAAPQIRTEA